MGGSTGGTSSGKDSDAAAAMRLDLPVARSPTTTTRTLVRPPEVEVPGIGSVRRRRCPGEQRFVPETRASVRGGETENRFAAILGL